MLISVGELRYSPRLAHIIMWMLVCRCLLFEKPTHNPRYVGLEKFMFIVYLLCLEDVWQIKGNNVL